MTESRRGRSDPQGSLSTAQSASEGAAEAMRTVSHAHRADPRNVFSELFRRGSTTPADGGDASKGTPREESDEEGAQTEDMEDVDHEGPEDAGVARVWKRGHEDTEE